MPPLISALTPILSLAVMFPPDEEIASLFSGCGKVIQIDAESAFTSFVAASGLMVDPSSSVRGSLAEKIGAAQGADHPFLSLAPFGPTPRPEIKHHTKIDVCLIRRMILP